VSIDDEGNLFVGRVAKEKMITDPDRTASVFKRSMGTGKDFVLGSRKYSAVDLSALVLRSLKEDAEVFTGEEVTEAIISVPAYFNDVQRKATKQAGELAGLKVERIINEPTAAAIAYGITRDDEEKRFLVFDLGGGTFDVSILELDRDIMEVRAIAGDNYLGGEDFTEVIYKMFIKQHNIDESSLTTTAIKHLYKQAELCKIGFSEGNVSKMTAAVDGKTLELEISSAEYEMACADLLEKLKKPIERSLKDAKLKVADLDEIMVNNISNNDYYQMVQDFYTVQDPYPALQNHRRVFHMILTARVSKGMERSLDEGAEAFLEYMKLLGHQVLLVPHYGSVHNAEHYHWHAVVNVKSYLTGKTLLDKYGEFKLICEYMNQQPYTYWKYSYHISDKIVPAQYF
jgi:hypothetical protein